MAERELLRLMRRTLEGTQRQEAGKPEEKSWVWVLRAVVGARIAVLDTLIMSELVPRLVYTDQFGDVVEREQPDVETVVGRFQSTYNQSKVCTLEGPLSLQQVAESLPIAKGFVEEMKWVGLRWEDLRKEVEKVGELKAIQCMRYACKHKPQATIIHLIRAKGEGTYTSTLYAFEHGKARIENNLQREEAALASTVEILHSVEKKREVRVLDLEAVYLQDENKRLWLQLTQKCIVQSWDRGHIPVTPDLGPRVLLFPVLRRKNHS
jgi:hypothetical protein